MRRRLQSVGLSLPDPPSALGRYVPARRAGPLVYTAGQLPLSDGTLVEQGVVGVDVDEHDAKECARVAALNALAAASTVCDLDRVKAVVGLTGYVASAPAFTSQPAVVDGASEVLIAAFGEDVGRHARVAVGVSALPLGSPVEISLVLDSGDD